MAGASTNPIRCYICGKQIVGKYYIDWAGHCVCASHMSTLAHCSICRQFCDHHAKAIGRGMMACQHCQKYRIEQAEAGKVIQYIQHLYSQTPLGRIEGWQLKMANAEAMFRLTKDDKARGLAQATGNKYTIYILRDLSQVAFAQVLAHEMLHVYQYARHLTPPQPRYEGFCNLGSYYVLTAIGNPEAKAAIEGLRKDASPIYGAGFRDMLSCYTSGGWDAAIRHLRG